jgi:hypothetical protein
MKPVELFHIGPQKAGTTWIYRCLRQHPQIAAPPQPAIHYFDMFYARGRDWYAGFFAGAREDQRLFDPTYSYIRSPLAADRIARENPRARIALCLRNPIERAHSHYWHERKKGVLRYAFSEVLENYDLFASWLEPGFYAAHIERYLEHFPREQLLCQRFERLAADPRGFLNELLGFAGVATDFEPPELAERINPAGPLHSRLSPAYWLYRSRRSLERIGVSQASVNRWRDAVPALRGRAEYERGIPPDLYARLLEVCEPEIARLEALLGLDLSAWRQPAGEVRA